MLIFRFVTNPSRAGSGIAVLRMVTGVIILMHGWQKFFGMGVGGVTGFFTQVGVPVPAVIAPLIVTLELAGGIALILGLFTRLIALGIAIDLTGAIYFVHFRNGFFGGKGYEFPLLIVASAIAIFIAGPGAYAIDNVLFSRRTERVGR